MLSNGLVVGVIHMDTTKGVSTFSDGDLQLLSVIANTVGPAIKGSSGRSVLGKIPSVFISYSHDDRAFANRLTSDLRRRGIKVYIDERLQVGEGWRKQLAVAIETTDAFVLIMSPPSVASEYVEWELGTAQALDKKIFPLMYRESGVPKTILPLQYINISQDYEKGLDELAERLHKFHNPPDAPPHQIALSEAHRLDQKLAPAASKQDGVAPLASEHKVTPRTSYVLHLSDLHFGTEENALNWHSQLVEDLLNELTCDRLDAVIISGDVSNKADENEFKAAIIFLEKLRREFGLDKRQMVIVPGNHDLSRVVAKKAYKLFWREEYRDHELPEGTYIEDGNTIAIRDEEEYKQRFANFSAFYEQVKGKPYPLDYENQYVLEHLPELNLLVLGLNSAWELDHRYTLRASIHPLAVSNALEEIRRRPEYAGCLRIATWHHPLHSEAEDRIKAADFMDRLAVSNFRLAFHGHIHKAETSIYLYDYSRKGRKLDVIAAGTFGAPVREWVPGYPLQYNLLKLQADTLTVETRRREKLNGAWQPDARWTTAPGRDPLPRYVIEL
jgi:3',5'-cyclic AMP phosphodiesterase CpdA